MEPHKDGDMCSTGKVETSYTPPNQTDEGQWAKRSISKSEYENILDHTLQIESI